MSNIMQALRTDHSNFTHLLDLLRDALEILHEGDRPNYTAMLDSVDYLQDYADLYHHPKEDFLYQYYLERSIEGQEVIQELMQQHLDLKQRTTRLRKTLEGLLHDAVVSKKQLMNQLSDFIERQTVHLLTEEANIFPLLEQKLTAHDWRQLAAMLPTRIDPLFGSRVASQYAALYERIAETS